MQEEQRSGRREQALGSTVRYFVSCEGSERNDPIYLTVLAMGSRNICAVSRKARVSPQSRPVLGKQLWAKGLFEKGELDN